MSRAAMGTSLIPIRRPFEQRLRSDAGILIHAVLLRRTTKHQLGRQWIRHQADGAPHLVTSNFRPPPPGNVGRVSLAMGQPAWGSGSASRAL